jgi:hypothetical protein
MMRLESLTWQQFLVATLAFSAVWYAVVGLLYYRKEISLLFSKDKLSEPLAHGWQDRVDDLEPGLIGAAAEEHGVSVLEADEFSFLPREAVTEVDSLGELADMQQEIKGICTVLGKEDGSKEDFMALFIMIRNKYPKVATSELLPELNAFIREQAPFHISQEELESLWG